MAWRWVGKPTIPSEFERTWPSQGDAETWLGEYYPDLREAGVRTVALYEEDRLVYGPMSLDPDGD
ncbi:MAG: hypothetical protein L0H41_09035 [Microlunatus sp.]|nr:hypothetical protein [Microlunatus sp.]MDN5770521.1 hypothetical protein [Microlunatus sp.]MDN5804687.1 hypothetical protein [Microlunatus sp.]